MAEEQIRIRMYRVGFGDCFLLTLPEPGGAPRHVLIDCGVHHRGDIKTLESVVKNIAEETGKQLAIVIATHAHRDHVHGFGRFAEVFRTFLIGEVWMPWTENPSDQEATKLRKKKLDMVAKLSAHFHGLSAADQTKFDTAMNAVANIAGNEKAMSELRNGFHAGAKVTYYEAPATTENAGKIQGLTVRFLGPPRNTEFLGRMDPPAGQKYLTGGGTGGAGAALFASYSPSIEILKLPAAEEKYVNEFAEASPDKLAFTLDSAVNNTSLVTLFCYRGQTLLFAGDAQWGNWQNWIHGEDAADLLSRVSFYKVSHHGSENATPIKMVEHLTKGRFAAMVSTQGAPFPTIPRLPLLTALDAKSGNRVARSDSVDVVDAPVGPAELPKEFVKGALWVDHFISV
jgi:beta-lactamase superfamily II metal-dependent hydrolase